MARDGSGTFNLAQAAFTSGTTIESAKVNSDLSDIAAGLTQSISKDGQTTYTANQPMGGFKITGLGAATAGTDAARADQVIGSPLDYADDSGTATAYAIAPSPGISAYAVGQRFSFKAGNANSGADPTLDVNSVGAGIIYWPDGSSLIAGDIPADAQIVVQVATTDPTFHLQTPRAPRFAVIRSYLAGLETSNNSGSPNTKVDVTAGVCADDTNTQMLSFASGTIDLGTTGANALDTGTLANGTTYHLFGIGKTDGTTAFLASASLNSPTMPSGYTLKRRIWSVLADSSAHIRAYVQNGDEGLYTTRILDISAANPGTSAVTRSVSVPSGIVVDALVYLGVASTASGGSYALLSSLAVSDVIPAAGNAQAVGILNTNGVGAAPVRVRTDTSAQIRTRLSFSDTGVSITGGTYGWIDRRGRDA